MCPPCSQAPVGENYSGPVLFESLAAAQLFAELLPSNLTPARRPVPEPGRPANVLASEWEGRVGARVLPDWMDIADDSTQTEWRGGPLFGHYPVDLEGVAPRPVSIVEKGILKNYLLTRQPVVGSEGSTGHARLPGSFGVHTAPAGQSVRKGRGDDVGSGPEEKAHRHVPAAQQTVRAYCEEARFPVVCVDAGPSQPLFRDHALGLRRTAGESAHSHLWRFARWKRRVGARALFPRCDHAVVKGHHRRRRSRHGARIMSRTARLSR